MKKAWWQRFAVAVFLIAGALLILSPSRPLWPANSVLGRVQTAHRLVARAKTVYSVYSQRNDGFAPARDFLPPGLKVVGFMSFDDPEASLWRPFGSRRVEHIKVADTAEDLKRRGIEYALINSFNVRVLLEGRPVVGFLADQPQRPTSADLSAHVARGTRGPPIGIW